jgi:hypothetical protein
MEKSIRMKIKRPFEWQNNFQNGRTFRDMFTLGITLGNGVTGQIRKCENKERSNLKCVKMINTGEQGTK